MPKKEKSSNCPGPRHNHKKSRKGEPKKLGYHSKEGHREPQTTRNKCYSGKSSLVAGTFSPKHLEWAIERYSNFTHEVKKKCGASLVIS